ncbi:hypothetical protein DID76_03875 [Candidatus Marinamargulisbacteria bacterium SCGC AG-414-C22]|nr:hypothetical protein DID76_03875 [Candidatus Marinamargulisbacteria bacterium SCGC AG-414-C22]
MKKTSLYLLFLLFNFQVCISASTEAFLDQLKYAFEKKTTYPLISTQQASFNINRAYKLQKEWVEFLSKKQNKIGYKASLTSAESQKKFNINTPVSGVLFNTNIYQNFSIISLSDFKKPFLEIELGFYLKQNISTPIKSKEKLRSMISKITCIAEIPDLNVADSNKLTSADLIAVNAASKGILLGEEIPYQSKKDVLNIELIQNNKTVYSQSHKELLNTQIDNLFWLVNHLVSLGYTINKNELLITGSLNKAIPLKKGKYIINYDDISSIVFQTK